MNIEMLASEFFPIYETVTLSVSHEIKREITTYTLTILDGDHNSHISTVKVSRELIIELGSKEVTEMVLIKFVRSLSEYVSRNESSIVDYSVTPCEET